MVLNKLWNCNWCRSIKARPRAESVKVFVEGMFDEGLAKRQHLSGKRSRKCAVRSCVIEWAVRCLKSNMCFAMKNSYQSEHVKLNDKKLHWIYSKWMTCTTSTRHMTLEWQRFGILYNTIQCKLGYLSCGMIMRAVPRWDSISVLYDSVIHSGRTHWVRVWWTW